MTVTSEQAMTPLHVACTAIVSVDAPLGVKLIEDVGAESVEDWDDVARVGTKGDIKIRNSVHEILITFPFHSTDSFWRAKKTSHRLSPFCDAPASPFCVWPRRRGSPVAGSV